MQFVSGHKCIPRAAKAARDHVPRVLGRGSFDGCGPDCTARHDDVLCDKCGVPWDYHCGHGCNDRHRRGSFHGCDRSCTSIHDGMQCDKCHQPWELHASGHVCGAVSALPAGLGSLARARGSFGGCPSDCTARHEDVLCDKCSIPWELHSSQHSGHGCNDRFQRGSFEGCDKNCSATHEGEQCDKCHEPYLLHCCGHYCDSNREHGTLLYALLILELLSIKFCKNYFS
jgi:hypothetical protein